MLLHCHRVTFSSHFLCLLITGELMFLNEATLLDNIKNRYYKDKIYVSLQRLVDGKVGLNNVFLLFSTINRLSSPTF
jgi:hypothetical protein